MGRVLFLAGLLAIIPAELAAQSRGGTGARSGAAAPSAGAAGAAGAMHASSLAPAGAVTRGAASPGSHLVASHPPNGQVVLRRAAGVNATRGSSRVQTAGGIRTRRGQLTTARRRNSVSEFSGDSGSVPGLGFDYSHLAATRPNTVNGRHSRNDSAVLFPFFDGGGYFVPTGPGVVDAQSEAQQAEDADEEDSAPADRPARVRRVDRLPVTPELGPPAPQADVPEYVFVRRDGTVFFAVAYSWERGSLRYVSSEGLRRSVARETLDLDATQQFNEQRGMTFRSPA
jgi:hypothetical protein